MSIQLDQKVNLHEPMLMIDRRTEKRKNVKIIGQILAAASACITAISCGSTLSWTSPCLDFFENLNSTAPFHISKEEGSWVGSLVAIGALFSAIPAGILVDKFGRKITILALAIPFTFSWVIIIKSVNIWSLYIGRIFAGIGIGGTCTMIPMYLSEITEDVTRGPICSLFPLFFSIGVLLSFVVHIWAEYYLLSYILSIVPIVFGVTFMFMPETPVYLAKCGKDKQAKLALNYLRGDYYDANSELLEIKKEICNSCGEKATLMEILRDGVYFKSLLACVILFIFQQFSGINAVIFYTVPIFKAANSSLDPLLSSILVASIQVIVTILVVYIVDKLGRKVYMSISAIIMAICLFFLGLYFHFQYLNITSPVLDLIPLISLMIYIFSFSFGFGPIPWIIVGEINSPEIIGTVSAIAMVANWACGFFVTKSFAPLLAAIGAHWTFYAYSSFNIMAVFLVFFFVPETRFKLPHEVFGKK